MDMVLSLLVYGEPDSTLSFNTSFSQCRVSIVIYKAFIL